MPQGYYLTSKQKCRLCPITGQTLRECTAYSVANFCECALCRGGYKLDPDTEDCTKVGVASAGMPCARLAAAHRAAASY